MERARWRWRRRLWTRAAVAAVAEVNGRGGGGGGGYAWLRTEGARGGGVVEEGSRILGPSEQRMQLLDVRLRLAEPVAQIVVHTLREPIRGSHRQP